MLLLEVLVLLVVLLGVLALAGGFGGRLSQPARDLPDVGLPQGPLRAADVEGLRLSVALRGYRMDQVDEVLDRLQLEIAGRDETIERLQRGSDAEPEPASEHDAEQPWPSS